MDKIVLGIPTFKRPQGLINLLNSIAEQVTNYELVVLVADNDPINKEGIKAAEQLQSRGYRWPIHKLSVPEKGISAVRNAIINKAFFELDASAVCMLDDDQLVDIYWLQNIIDMQISTNTDVVGSYTVPKFEVAEPKWSKGLYVYWRDKFKDGATEIIYGTGGVLLNRSVIELVSVPFFDEEFGLSGGGDAEFFKRLKSRGATFSFAGEAIAYEIIPRDRTTKKWAFQRAYRIGNADMRIILLHDVKLGRYLIEIAKIIGAICYVPFRYLFNIQTPSGRMRGLLLFFRAKGKVATLFKHKYEEYKR